MSDEENGQNDENEEQGSRCGEKAIVIDELSEEKHPAPLVLT